jgi:hypothetical protein
MRHLDVPRVFVVTVSDGMLVFDSPFDEALDEYCSEYTVSFLPWSEARRLHGSWETLTEGAEARGRIPVEEVEFDKTRRLLELPFGRRPRDDRAARARTRPIT